jgi:predicted DNA-binding transcriptional regulator AlpA
MDNKELIYAVKQLSTALNHFSQVLEKEDRQEPIPISNRVLNEKELAAELGISYTAVRTMRQKENCPSFNIGKRVFFNLHEVLSWIKKKSYEKSKQQEEQNQYGKIRRID